MSDDGSEERPPALNALRSGWNRFLDGAEAVLDRLAAAYAVARRYARVHPHRARAAAAAAFVLVICVVMVVQALGPKPADYRIYQGDASKRAASVAEREGTFVVGVSTSVVDVAPYAHDDEAADILTQLVYEPLLRVNGEAQVEYVNARSVTFEGSGRRAVVELEHDRTFSNGVPLNADTVISSLQWFMGRTPNDTFGSPAARISTLERVGEYELVIQFASNSPRNIEALELPLVCEAPNQRLPRGIGTGDGGASAGSSDDEGPRAPANSIAVGTGAYRVASVEPYGDVVLEPSGLPGDTPYEQVIIRSFDYADLEGQLEEQAFDLFTVSEQQLADMRAGGTYDVYALEGAMGWYLATGDLDEPARASLAQLTAGEGFFNETQEAGIVAEGIVAARMAEPNCRSILARTDASLDGVDELALVSDGSGVSYAIALQLADELAAQDVEAVQMQSEVAVLDVGDGDVDVYRGAWYDALTEEVVAAIYDDAESIPAEDLLPRTERALTEHSGLIPLSREARYVAALPGRTTMGLI